MNVEILECDYLLLYALNKETYFRWCNWFFCTHDLVFIKYIDSQSVISYVEPFFNLQRRWNIDIYISKKILYNVKYSATFCKNVNLYIEELPHAALLWYCGSNFLGVVNKVVKQIFLFKRWYLILFVSQWF